MDSRIDRDFEQLDHRTCRSICDAVGERLQQSLRPEPSLSSDLQHLLNELRRREQEPPPVLIAASSNVAEARFRSMNSPETGCVWRRLR